MSDASDDTHEELDDLGGTNPDFFDHVPSKAEKIEMRRASKPPSEWLKLLCKDWALENEVLVETADAKFLDYKPYLKEILDPSSQQPYEFWEILGITDSFDRAYIVAQIERFCSLYSIRALSLDEPDHGLYNFDFSDPAAIAAAAAGASASPNGGIMSLPPYLDPVATAAAASAEVGKLPKKIRIRTSRASGEENDGTTESRKTKKRAKRRRKVQRSREDEMTDAEKAELEEQEATREERRRIKLEIKKEREKFAKEQKEAALRRAAELVQSNRVPIEITRGAAAARAAVQTAIPSPTPLLPPETKTKKRSAVVVSTASDLHQIVTHSKNLWAKYSAIAKEHNQKVSWATIARELGIHVKVREKYARMHSRAVQRCFDWERHGHWKLKDHPEIFLEPTPAEKWAKMPPPPPDPHRTVLIDGTKEVGEAAVAAAASVVDASVVPPPIDTVVQPTEEQTATAAAVATLVADPTATYTCDPARIASI